jgi:hypothetical protein
MPSSHEDRVQDRDRRAGVIIEVRVDLDREDEARRMVHDLVVPKAKALPGFQGGHWLRALDGDVIREVFTFDTEANARATAALVRSEGPPPAAPVTLHSVGAHELIAEA